jgi:hypothetical protein
MWAWRHAAGTGEPAKGESPADDFRELVDRLRLPAAVAAVGYARGARIRRVKISRAAKPARAKHEDTPIIILSRKMLKAVRAESAAPPALTARR